MVRLLRIKSPSPPVPADTQSTDPCRPSFDRIGRIIVARRGRMARRDEAVDERLVLLGDLAVERLRVAVPLRLGARTGHDAADQPVVEHPGDREVLRLDAALL